MSFPVEVALFGWAVTLHQLLELLAYVAGFVSYLYLRRRWPSGPPLTAEQTAWVVVGVLFGGLVGAKTLAWLEAWPAYAAHRHDVRALLSGKTVVGGLLGGWWGVELAKRCLRISHPSGDVYVFPLILGMVIGRVGCFSAGLIDGTHGNPTTLPFGVDFGDGVARHPTQLYEVVALLLLAAVFGWRIKTLRQRGCMFSQFAVGYLGYRFLVEFIKPGYGMTLLGLSPIQWASVAGIAFGIRNWNEPCCGKVAPPLVSRGRTDSAQSNVPRLLELTLSLCPVCLAKLEAKIIEESDGIFLQRFCPEHGLLRTRIASDVQFWREARALYKPPTTPQRRNTERRRGCPYDCGICPDHEQHGCLVVVEITEHCDMQCPICYAGSKTSKAHRSLDTIERMLDAAVENEGEVSVLQISGGEPTDHPEFFSVLSAVRRRKVRHLMINTNGVKIANDPQFVRKLASYAPAFEVYLQFDSLRPDVLRALRGKDYSAIRRQAVARLNEWGISTTLVVTVARGLNDQYLGEVVEFALGIPCVRGVTFQPLMAAGRAAPGMPMAEAMPHGVTRNERLSLTEIRSAILGQQSLFTEDDLLAVPCHPLCLAMAYALRRGGATVPLSRFVDPRILLGVGGNTIGYEQDPSVRARLTEVFSLGVSPEKAAEGIDRLCCAGPSQVPLALCYQDVFRVVIMHFMDRHDMDLGSLKRSCVHIVSPDGRLVPFETYNLLHRNRPDA